MEPPPLSPVLSNSWISWKNLSKVPQIICLFILFFVHLQAEITIKKLMMKKHIVIVEIVSTGFNYVEDALMRGYQPVVVECTYPGTEEDRAPFLVSREIARGKLPKGIPYIEETSDYAALLEQVRAYDPVLVVPGQDFAVELATHLPATGAPVAQLLL